MKESVLTQFTVIQSSAVNVIESGIETGSLYLTGGYLILEDRLNSTYWWGPAMEGFLCVANKIV